MVTVSHMVSSLVAQRPFLQEALVRGIVNHAALAEQLLPDIQKELNRPVKLGAVTMAVRRLSERLCETFLARPTFEDATHLSVRSGIIEVTLFKHHNLQEKVEAVSRVVDYKQGDLWMLTQGVNEMMLMVDAKHKARILAIFKDEDVKKVVEDLSSITINIPPDAIDTVGLFYLVTRALAWENVPIVEIVSTLTEMTFVINEDHIPQAFRILKETVR